MSTFANCSTYLAYSCVQPDSHPNSVHCRMRLAAATVAPAEDTYRLGVADSLLPLSSGKIPAVVEAAAVDAETIVVAAAGDAAGPCQRDPKTWDAAGAENTAEQQTDFAGSCFAASVAE